MEEIAILTVFALKSIRVAIVASWLARSQDRQQGPSVRVFAKGVTAWEFSKFTPRVLFCPATAVTQDTESFSVVY